MTSSELTPVVDGVEGPMNAALGVAQALLALAFGAVGFTKLRDDRLTYANARPPMTSFAEDLSDRLYKTLGVLELAGAAGVVLPRLIGIAPVLTPLAALGIVGLMIGAIVLHPRRRAPRKRCRCLSCQLGSRWLGVHTWRGVGGSADHE
jgi:uncharacterized membrane protein YphA (DoxX/SURF4 family)